MTASHMNVTGVQKMSINRRKTQKEHIRHEIYSGNRLV